MENLSVTSLPSRRFEYRMTHSIIDGGETFPFAVTSAAARNPQYETENRNCQDAVGICASKDYAVGVVCDGCSSTHTAFQQHSGSSNEVGAKLACTLLLRDLAMMLNRGRVLRPDETVARLSRNLLKGFKAAVQVFCGRDEVRAERFIYDCLMTTALGFVITGSQFFTFVSGDGIVAVNGTLDVLESNSEGVDYFSNDLLAICCPRSFPKGQCSNGLKLHTAGKATDLQSIFIATDGMSRLAKQNPDELSSFLMRKPTVHQCKNGFDFALPEFRRDIAWNPNVSLTLTDDAAFAVARRIAPAEGDAC